MTILKKCDSIQDALYDFYEGPKQHRQGITQTSPRHKVSNQFTDANGMVAVLSRGLFERS
jgi:hypothetical protein